MHNSENWYWYDGFPGSVAVPVKLAGRVVFLTFWLMSVLIYTSFTAALTTSLATAECKKLNTLEEILEDGLLVSVARGTVQLENIISVSRLLFITEHIGRT